MPVESHFQQACPYHQLVHLDASRRYRVDSSCESPARMVHEPWFVLPPVQEYYYRRYHPEYRTLPPFRRDCAEIFQAEAGRQVISLVYPDVKTAVYVPVDLDGRPGQVVFEAVHRRPRDRHLLAPGRRYLTATRHFHQVAAEPRPGRAPAGAHRRGRPAPGAPLPCPQPRTLTALHGHCFFKFSRSGKAIRISRWFLLLEAEITPFSCNWSIRRPARA